MRVLQGKIVSVGGYGSVVACCLSSGLAWYAVSVGLAKCQGTLYYRAAICVA